MGDNMIETYYRTTDPAVHLRFVGPFIPYDPKDPSPCEDCPTLKDWSAKQWKKLEEKDGQGKLSQED